MLLGQHQQMHLGDRASDGQLLVHSGRQSPTDHGQLEELAVMKNPMQNSQGSILLNTLIVAGIVASISAVIMSQTQKTSQVSRNPRIKSAMTSMETQILSLAMQPGIYQSCSQQATNCQLSSTATQAFEGLSRNFTGAHCPQNSQGLRDSKNSQNCGVHVQAASSAACLNPKNPGYNVACASGQFYNAATQTFCAEIIYQGSDVAMQSVCASTTVPQSVLQGDATTCASPADLLGPYPHVIFEGYDAAGNPVCGAIPSCSGGNVSLAGNYISSINPQTIQTTCSALNSTTMSCPVGSIISKFNWVNTASAFGPSATLPSADCSPRKPPPISYTVSAASPITVPPAIMAPPPTLPPVAASPAPTPSPVGSLNLQLICSADVGMCFVAGTPVTMADGSTKAIEKVQVGDWVQTFDESTGRRTVSPVIDVLHHQARWSTLYTFSFSDGTKVTSNDEHLFFLPLEKTYISGAALAARFHAHIDTVLYSQSGSFVSIKNVLEAYQYLRLYNIHVQSPYDNDFRQGHFGHNYFAGGVLVHNEKYCGGGKSAGSSNGGCGDYTVFCAQDVNTGLYYHQILACAVVGNDSRYSCDWANSMSGGIVSSTPCNCKH
jgi:hypothetical protein